MKKIYLPIKLAVLIVLISAIVWSAPKVAAIWNLKTGLKMKPVTPAQVDNSSAKHYVVNCAQDPILTDISAPALTHGLRLSENNAEALVELIRMSIESKQVEVAYSTLDEMCHEQPNNAVVLAAYAMAHDAGLYQVRKSSGVIPQRTAQEDQEYDAALKRATQLDPKLWLPYTLEGFRLGYSTDAKFDEGLDLLHKAVQLAPNSAFAQKQFAKILHGAAANKAKWEGKPVTFQQAAAVYETAKKLDPQSADVAYALFFTYDLDLKDKARATIAKRHFLKTLPPGYHLSKFVRERLALYPD